MRDGDTDRLPILTGSAWVLGLDVTAAILLAPGHEAAPEPARHLLAAVAPDLAGRIRPGDFLVGGGDFGRGAAGAAPARAVRGAGVAAVIASSFDPRFAEESLRLGLPVLEVNEALVIHTGARLRVDLEGARVVNMSSGDRFPIRNADEPLLARLRAGARG